MALLLCSFEVQADDLNDTGIRPDQYSNETNGGLTNDFGAGAFLLNLSYPRQDPQFGRDAAQAAGALDKVGGGVAGFDFTRLCGNGDEEGTGTCPNGLTSASIGDGEGQWSCTRDNVTGRTWEVKTDDDGLRDALWAYSWYNTDPASNGGEAGSQNPDSNPAGCGEDLANCNTAEYAAAVSALNAGSGLCGFTDWRLPTKQELRSIMDYGELVHVQIDTDYFPNTIPSLSSYWSAAVSASDPVYAIYVRYDYGIDHLTLKSSATPVRLVRSQP